MSHPMLCRACGRAMAIHRGVCDRCGLRAQRDPHGAEAAARLPPRPAGIRGMAMRRAKLRRKERGRWRTDET